MNFLLWILQILLALHTAVGAVWKFSHPAQSVPALQVLPTGVWRGLGFLELGCSAVLLLPLVVRSWGPLASVAAMVVAAEMLLFSGLHLWSGDRQHGHLFYWLVVAALCTLLVWGRFASKTA